MSYAQRIPNLLQASDPVDIVADVMTINCTRWQQIAFSSQYFSAGQRVLVRSESKATSIDDLNGTRMCVANGSTNQDELKKNYKQIIAVPVDDISDCMVLFQRGEVDSVTGDDTVLAGFVTQDPYAKMIGPPITDEPYGLGIEPERRRLRPLRQQRARRRAQRRHLACLVREVAPDHARSATAAGACTDAR